MVQLGFLDQKGKLPLCKRTAIGKMSGKHQYNTTTAVVDYDAP